MQKQQTQNPAMERSAALDAMRAAHAQARGAPSDSPAERQGIETLADLVSPHLPLLTAQDMPSLYDMVTSVASYARTSALTNKITDAQRELFAAFAKLAPEQACKSASQIARDAGSGGIAERLAVENIIYCITTHVDYVSEDKLPKFLDAAGLAIAYARTADISTKASAAHSLCIDRMADLDPMKALEAASHRAKSTGTGTAAEQRAVMDILRIIENHFDDFSGEDFPKILEAATIASKFAHGDSLSRQAANLKARCHEAYAEIDPLAALENAHKMAIDAPGESAREREAVRAIISIVNEHLDYFAREDMPAVKAAIEIAFRYARIEKIVGAARGAIGRVDRRAMDLEAGALPLARDTNRRVKIGDSLPDAQAPQTPYRKRPLDDVRRDITALLTPKNSEGCFIYSPATKALIDAVSERNMDAVRRAVLLHGVNLNALVATRSGAARMLLDTARAPDIKAHLLERGAIDSKERSRRLGELRWEIETLTGEPFAIRKPDAPKPI